MRRRDFIMLVGGAALAWALAAHAQRPAKVPRIGFLWPGSPSVDQNILEAFRQGLREHGYVEGQNIVVDHRWAEGRFERLPGFAAELVRSKVDMIIASEAPGARAAKQATTTIPIVMVGVGGAVETGLIDSLARPGGNMTGPVVLTPEMSVKRLELLKEIAPGLTRIAVLWNAANPVKVVDWKETQAAARILNLSLQSHEVRGPDDFEPAFAAIARERPNALIALPDPLMNSQGGRVVEFAAKNRLPAIYGTRAYAEVGGLVSYSIHGREVYRRAAWYVDKILKGAKPAELPAEQPTKFEMLINLKTAKALGLTIPSTLLARADEVIE